MHNIMFLVFLIKNVFNWFILSVDLFILVKTKRFNISTIQQKLQKHSI